MSQLTVVRPRRSRSAAAYSHQTFLWTICRSVRRSVRRSVQCIVEKRRIVGRTGLGIRQVGLVAFGDRSTGRGTFGGEFGERHCICFHCPHTMDICPVPKVPQPRSHNEFRPISITPVLTRIIERTIVKQFIYPSFQADRTTIHSPLQISLPSAHPAPPRLR